jgi:carboxymethylenebutenolidase
MTDIDLSALAAARHGSQPLRATCRPHRPGVVMIHEIFDLDDVMRRDADHLAGLGYLTLAVDLFS